MRCPFCSMEAHRRALHAHLAATHADGVTTAAKSASTLMLTYEVSCPQCPFVVKRIVNPRGQDASFLEENSSEIRLVAFDQLLYHLESAHPDPTELAAEG